jgi:hypothetical protein
MHLPEYSLLNLGGLLRRSKSIRKASESPGCRSGIVSTQRVFGLSRFDRYLRSELSLSWVSEELPMVYATRSLFLLLNSRLLRNKFGLLCISSSTFVSFNDARSQPRRRGDFERHLRPIPGLGSFRPLSKPRCISKMVKDGEQCYIWEAVRLYPCGHSTFSVWVQDIFHVGRAYQRLEKDPRAFKYRVPLQPLAPGRGPSRRQYRANSPRTA